uniref:Uncharacterized protein n=2 Tax=Rhinopithecus TaxID=542827 RepID=A0A2K6LG02_RHIBE
MSCLQSVWLIVRFCAFDDNPFFGSGSFSSVAPSVQPLLFPLVLLTPSLPVPVCTPTSSVLGLPHSPGFLAWSDWVLLTPSLSLQTEGFLRSGPGLFGVSLTALGVCSRYIGWNVLRDWQPRSLCMRVCAGQQPGRCTWLFISSDYFCEENSILVKELAVEKQ